KNLLLSNQDFINMQESLLEEIGEYTKTRYDIISLSLQKIIEEHEDFRELLLYISFLNSQNILKNLLETFKNAPVIDKFIFNLKKYSLIKNEPSISTSGDLFSIHRSTQNIQLEYLRKNIKIDLISNFIHEINSNFENYLEKTIDDEHLLKMNLLLQHCESFLKKNEFLNSASFNGAIYSKLGCLYYYLGQHIKAKQLLEKSLMKLNKNRDQNHVRLSWTLAFLGDIHRFNGDYLKAKLCLNASLENYKKYDSKNYDRI